AQRSPRQSGFGGLHPLCAGRVHSRRRACRQSLPPQGWCSARL
ncbi:MAG: hypothetical protein AVDCRST_MAG23-1557, partial [uncultured Sphingosinicella sp.]